MEIEAVQTYLARGMMTPQQTEGHRELGYYHNYNMIRPELFVTYLYNTCDERSLKAYFRAFNPRSAKICYRNDGTSKMCGFVDFMTFEDAANAWKLLNNTYFNGRVIK
jgi:RNA recognition motif-containing protein